jgi:hypothetical protein
VGSSQDGPFIVMELVTGPSLRELLDQSGSLAPEKVLSVAKDVLSALMLAHRDGLVHRDIKPSNILMTSEGVAKLTDFGISRSLTQTTEITGAGLFTGTIAYSAPEQLAGDDVGDSSDLYSLGCVLYECLSGHPPFESDDVNRLAFQQRFADPPPISDRVNGLSSDLAGCVMRALEKEPGSRQQSASAMLAEIKAASLDPPSESTVQLALPKSTRPDGRTTSWRELQRIRSAKGRRNTRIVLAAISLAVTALAATVVIWRPWSQRIGSSTLSSGAVLKPNSTLSSPNGGYRLVMQPSGSLTLQLARTGEPIWATNSGGHPGAYAVMQHDGNLEVHLGVGTPVPGRQRSALYQTSTSGHNGATLHVLDDGNLVVQDRSSGRWLWQSGSGPASLGPKLITTQGLHPLQYMRSPNGAFELTNDGWTGQLRLIAVKSPQCSMWVEPAAGLSASVSALLPDGNFVMLAPLAHQTWSSGTSGNPNVQLVLGNDGALTLTSTTGAVVWQAATAVSHTAGCRDK